MANSKNLNKNHDPERVPSRARFVLTRPDLLTERQEKMAKMILDGRSTVEVADAFGCSRVHVTNALHSAERKIIRHQRGIVKNRSVRQRNARAEQCEQLLQKYPEGFFSPRERQVMEYFSEGCTVAQTCEILGVTRSTVNEIWMTAKRRLTNPKILHTRTKPKEQLRKERLARTKLLWERGLINADIARDIEVDGRQVARDLKTLGLEPNKKVHETKHPLSTVEAARVCNFTEKNVILRRLARGMSINEMVQEDGSTRGVILNAMWRLGIEIPEGEKWVWFNGDKRRWDAPAKKQGSTGRLGDYGTLGARRIDWSNVA